jgi:hypothetical protein
MITPQQRTLAIITGRYDPLTDTGYYGFVDSSELITGKKLIKKLKFDTGKDHNSKTGWLKFYIGPNASCNTSGKEKIIFVAKKPLKSHISWEQLDYENLVEGNRSVRIKKQYYSVRLMSGKGVDLYGTNSEWNELMYRVYQCNPDNKHKSNWEFFSDLDLSIGVGRGKWVWAAESVRRHSFRTNTPESFAYARGGRDIDTCKNFEDIDSYDDTGWRPVLEPITHD